MRSMLAANAADLDFSNGTQEGLNQYWLDVQKIFDRFGPMYISTKLDGVRGSISFTKEVMSRTWKKISSKKIQEVFGHEYLMGLDGEFIAGSETDPNAMQASNSATSKQSSQVIPTFNIFDHCISQDSDYTERYNDLLNFQRFAANLKISNGYPEWCDHVKVVKQELISSSQEARSRVESFIQEGYEGGMLRLPASPYKQGRSTLKEGYLLKLKIWADADAKILYAYEAQHNCNEATKNELGYTKRSSSASGKVPAGYLGGYHVRDLTTGIEFDIGIAVKGVWTLADRERLWKQRYEDIGKTIKYRYFPTGIVDKPRFPKFVAFRDPKDL